MVLSSDKISEIRSIAGRDMAMKVSTIATIMTPERICVAYERRPVRSAILSPPPTMLTPPTESRMIIVAYMMTCTTGLIAANSFSARTE